MTGFGAFAPPKAKEESTAAGIRYLTAGASSLQARVAGYGVGLRNAWFRCREVHVRPCGCRGGGLGVSSPARGLAGQG